MFLGKTVRMKVKSAYTFNFKKKFLISKAYVFYS